MPLLGYIDPNGENSILTTLLETIICFSLIGTDQDVETYAEFNHNPYYETNEEITGDVTRGNLFSNKVTCFNFYANNKI